MIVAQDQRSVSEIVISDLRGDVVPRLNESVFLIEFCHCSNVVLTVRILHGIIWKNLTI